ncbi:hypothetical protein [uncultured Kordia sp.]|uniref:hypothetical protein n=1 Tax=uncultured Kordia sp. TaxID=507699 RepID=UPI00261F120E|nr:hypothetical protein [uncultured Kordia sp.]
MKYIKLILLFSLILTIECKAQQAQVNIDTEIIGTWVSEDDPKIKLVFNSDGQCLEYYDSVLSDTFSYSISNQCEEELDVNTWFLKMIDSEDLDEYCYELYGANYDNNNTLSMRFMGNGKIYVYNKVN